MNILAAAVGGAGVVVGGGAYAALLALHRLKGAPSFAVGAELAFALLLASVLALVASLDLDGAWLALIGALVVGYRYAPAAIWRLCIGTHAAAAAEDSR